MQMLAGVREALFGTAGYKYGDLAVDCHEYLAVGWPEERSTFGSLSRSLPSCSKAEALQGGTSGLKADIQIGDFRPRRGEAFFCCSTGRRRPLSTRMEQSQSASSASRPNFPISLILAPIGSFSPPLRIVTIEPYYVRGSLFVFPQAASELSIVSERTQ